MRYPPGGNSGIYLRGRYEVQVLDGPAEEPDPHLQGAVYGFLTPSQIVTNGPRAWHTFDITLVGRTVTVAVNGVTVIGEQLIPGITGGALDSDEGTPGPLMLQGDQARSSTATSCSPRRSSRPSGAPRQTARAHERNEET